MLSVPFLEPPKNRLIVEPEFTTGLKLVHDQLLLIGTAATVMGVKTPSNQTACHRLGPPAESATKRQFQHRLEPPSGSP